MSTESLRSKLEGSSSRIRGGKSHFRGLTSVYRLVKWTFFSVLETLGVNRDRRRGLPKSMVKRWVALSCASMRLDPGPLADFSLQLERILPCATILSDMCGSKLT